MVSITSEKTMINLGEAIIPLKLQIKPSLLVHGHERKRQKKKGLTVILLLSLSCFYFRRKTFAMGYTTNYLIKL